MLSIHSLIPEPEDLLSLELEDLGGIVLEFFKSSVSKQTEYVRFSDIKSDQVLKGYPSGSKNDIFYALSEAVEWLKNEGLLGDHPDQSHGDFLIITRRGWKLETAAAVEAYRKTKLLPKELLHSTLVDKVWPLFSRGDYNTAVFQAFKTLEIAVRYTGKYSEEDCDVELMKKAFNPESGQLTVATQADEEKQATLALFAGAMGLYKNPTCHRNLDINAEKASEAIIFASHLLKIVDSKISESTQP